MAGYTAYGLGYYDGQKVAARTFEPSPSIEHAVAAYIAAFGDVPATVKSGGAVVWTSRFRQTTEATLNRGCSQQHSSPVIRVQDGCRNCGRKVGHMPNCPRRF